MGFVPRSWLSITSISIEPSIEVKNYCKLVPVWIPHLQNRLCSGKSLPPIIWPMRCTSAISLSLHLRFLFQIVTKSSCLFTTGWKRWICNRNNKFHQAAYGCNIFWLLAIDSSHRSSVKERQVLNMLYTVRAVTSGLGWHFDSCQITKQAQRENWTHTMVSIATTSLT